MMIADNSNYFTDIIHSISEILQEGSMKSNKNSCLYSIRKVPSKLWQVNIEKLKKNWTNCQPSMALETTTQETKKCHNSVDRISTIRRIAAVFLI